MVYQTAVSTCGQACVRNLLVLILKDEDFATSVIHLDCDDFLEIRQELKEHGFVFQGYEVNDLSVIKKEHFPLVAQVRNDEASHFVVVKKIHHGKVFLDDPQFGEMILSEKEFKEVFLGKMLLRIKEEKVPLKPLIPALSFQETWSYLLLTILETLSFTGLFYFMNQDTAFVLLIVLGIGSLILIILQNLLNFRFRKRLEKEILIPYLKLTRNQNDFPMMTKVINSEVNRASNLVSYTVLLLLSLCLVVSNGAFISTLSLLGMLFPFAFGFLSKEKNYADRYCSFKEANFMRSFKSAEINIGALKESNKKAMKIRNEMVFSWMLEIIVISILIILKMTLSHISSLNFFLFHLILTLTVTKAVNGMKKTYLEDYERVNQINALSYPLSSFLLKKDFPLGYTNSTIGGFVDGSKSAHNRLPRQNRSEKEPS